MLQLSLVAVTVGTRFNLRTTDNWMCLRITDSIKWQINRAQIETDT